MLKILVEVPNLTVDTDRPARERLWELGPQ